MNSGIAISTYFDETSSPKRLDIFKQCLDSLRASGYEGKVFIVDDCSKTAEHILYCDGFIVCRRPFNGGTARVKNTSLLLLMKSGCDYLFLADDDMIFKPGWDKAYIEAMKQMDMAHMSYACDHMPISEETYCGVKIKRILNPTVNGCFLTMTRDLINQIGGFRVLPYIYGHSHENFSMRCLKFDFIPFYCDLQNVKDYIELNPLSHTEKSRKVDLAEADRNMTAFQNMVRYGPFKE
jgi:GT2 family glycosyltransferase